MKQVTSYELKQNSRIDEINADAYILEHKKTGARVFLLECEDTNKVFTIGFRTPPNDSTGSPHIIEHTVLCGSKKYPCKDPFIELAKGSLNTFLNAMTYPDKTVYPVASCNDKDFENLTDVYCDAVFNPNIYREKKIFMQEGWHYEIESPDDELTYNGVVYNEMKGVYSSPDSLLERAIGKVLFKNHTYGTESGGDPDDIPALTYEDFINFHKRYYHPSNSYIYIYGNVDMAAMLERIDKDYLSKYDRLEIDSAVQEVPEWDEVRDVSFDYPISDSEDENKSTILSIHNLVGGEMDQVKYLAYQILEDVLLSVPGAPVREALQQAGIGDDIGGGYASGIRQPYFSVTAKNCTPEDKETFVRIIKDTLAKQARELDHEALLASINIMEFRTREADFGSYPKGLIYGLGSFDTWLYDGDPTASLRYEETFAELRKKVDEGYFEELIREGLLSGKSEAIITLNPVKGLAEKKEKELADKLAEIKAGMSREELTAIAEETKALKEYQSSPSSEEDLMKIPLLSREDIEKKVQQLPYEYIRDGRKRIIFSDVFTSGIAYIKLVYSLKNVAPEDIPYVSFLTEVLGYIDTDKHTYAEMSTLINLNSGGIGFSVDSYVDSKDDKRAVFTFAANAKVLYDKVGFAFDAIDEMLFESKLDDKKRLSDIIAEVRARNKEALLAAGHQIALNRAGSQISDDRWFFDNTKGIAYYRMLENLEADVISEKLIKLAGEIFRPENCLYDFICDEAGLDKCKERLAKEEDSQNDENIFDGDMDYAGSIKYGAGRHEVFTAATMVNYVARFGNFKSHGYEYTGALPVLKVLLNYNYLWNNIRVLGGAYGCSSIFGMSGGMGFSSFRDPNLLKTDETFKNVAQFVETYEADEREMTKAVIGAISELDTPLTPLMKGMRALSAFFSKVTEEDRQKTRDEVLSVTPDAVRALAPVIKAALSDDCVCALAGEASAKECPADWIKENLYSKNH